MTDLETAQQSLEHEKQKIKLLGVLERLEANPDFQLLIVTGYLVNAVADYAKQGGQLTNLTSNSKLSVKEQMDYLAEVTRAPGHLERYLDSIRISGNNARERIEEYEEYVASIAASEGFEQ